MCAIPYLSRVDAGTVEMVRARGVEIVSSGDLVQQFEAAWTSRAAGLASGGIGVALPHQGSGVRDGSRRGRARGRSLTEYELQQQMVRWFEEEGLVSDSAPVVAVGGNAGNPHYLPTADQCRAIVGRRSPAAGPLGQEAGRGRSVCRHHVGRRYVGARARRGVARVSTPSPRRATPPCALVEDAARDGRDLRGWEVDRGGSGGARRQRGYGDRIVHRTGHSLGESVHGNGVHMDDYETHDDRRLLPGTGFTVEPGLYFETLRRAHRNQRVSGRARGNCDRTATERGRDAGVNLIAASRPALA